MPSPIGHALGGVAAGWLVRGAPDAFTFRQAWREGALFAALGMAADLDLLVGLHSGPSHGIGLACIAAAAAWLPRRGVAARDRLPLALACVLAYASHILLDWLGTDSSPPIGIMALWPFSREYFESGLHVFRAVSRRFYQPELFWAQNVNALARELLILVPPVVLVAVIRRRRSVSASAGSPTPP